MTRYIWPAGIVEIVTSIDDIPESRESLGGWDGYQLYRVRDKIYAVEE